MLQSVAIVFDDVVSTNSRLVYVNKYLKIVTGQHRLDPVCAHGVINVMVEPS